MGKIHVFVSFRREDSRHQRDRIYDHLVPQFGNNCVFQNVDNQNSDFHHDMERLVGRIKSAVSAPRVAAPEPVASPPPVSGRRRPPWKAIVAAAVLGLVLLGVIVNVATDSGQTTIVRAPRRPGKKSSTPSA